MEPVFENRYVRDEETAKEISAFLYLKRPLSIVVGIMCIICFASDLLLLILGYEYSAYGFILLPIYLAFKYYCYFVSKSSFIKRDAELHKGQVVITMQVYEDHISAIGPDKSEIELEYSKVKKAASTKNYVIFISKARIMYIFKKDGFTKGNMADFTAFIKNKGIKIKP